MISVEKLGQSDFRRNPPRTCWECEAPRADLVEVRLPTPSILSRTVWLCTYCFKTYYLSLVAGTADVQEAASEPCCSPARLPGPIH